MNGNTVLNIRTAFQSTVRLVVRMLIRPGRIFSRSSPLSGKLQNRFEFDLDFHDIHPRTEPNLSENNHEQVPEQKSEPWVSHKGLRAVDFLAQSLQKRVDQSANSFRHIL